MSEVTPVEDLSTSLTVEEPVAASVDPTGFMNVQDPGPPPPERHPRLGRPTHRYRYNDDEGHLLGFVWRFEMPDGVKDFRWLTLSDVNGRQEWRWAGMPSPRPLYCVDLLKARPQAPVLVVEGEKCADAARDVFRDSVVVTSSGGANAAAKTDWAPLNSRSVIIWTDADEPGSTYGQDVAEALRAAGVVEISFVDVGPMYRALSGREEPPPAGWDVADAVADHRERVHEELINCIKPWSPGVAVVPAAAAGPGGSPKQILFGFLGDAELFRDEEGETYACISFRGERRTVAINEQTFADWLSIRWVQAYPDAPVPGERTIKEIVNTARARALDGPVHAVFVRIGHHSGRIYVDLGDATGRCVEISADGWKILPEAPVRFLRPRGMLPLPEPEMDNDEAGLKAILDLVPLDADTADTVSLIVGHLLACFMPSGSLPHLCIGGRQGSGKSTLSRRLRAVLDPNVAPTRQPPRDEADLMISARNSAVLVFDNVSSIDAPLSDALCRLSTGAGFSRRRLYTDVGEVLVQAQRIVILTAIPDVVRFPDLADRMIFIELQKRVDNQSEQELDAEFDCCRPMMLGRIYTALAAALKGHKSETATPGERLVDFERFARAGMTAFALDKEAFSAALKRNRENASHNLVDDDPVVGLLDRLLVPGKVFEGKAPELLSELQRLDHEGNGQSLPKSPRGLADRLKRLTPALEASGIEARQIRRGHVGERYWRIERSRPRPEFKEEF